MKSILGAVVSFKVSKRLKELMDKYKDRVNWPERLRKFVEETVSRLEAEENYKLIIERLEKASWTMPRGFSSRSVREDRDSN